MVSGAIGAHGPFRYQLSVSCLSNLIYLIWKVEAFPCEVL